MTINSNSDLPTSTTVILIWLLLMTAAARLFVLQPFRNPAFRTRRFLRVLVLVPRVSVSERVKVRFSDAQGTKSMGTKKLGYEIMTTTTTTTTTIMMNINLNIKNKKKKKTRRRRRKRKEDEKLLLLLLISRYISVSPLTTDFGIILHHETVDV